eukprot:Filipodium_phascolosomae@DN6475_c0_g1_i1.p1
MREAGAGLPGGECVLLQSLAAKREGPYDHSEWDVGRGDPALPPVPTHGKTGSALPAVGVHGGLTLLFRRIPIRSWQVLVSLPKVPFGGLLVRVQSIEHPNHLVVVVIVVVVVV